ncbi:MAG: hypothetical protein U1E10_16150 [Bdellovibrionales bacterium]|jgi:hypothetical protein|nr:hypothetical protein [Bdellovibrionales bacterium]
MPQIVRLYFIVLATMLTTATAATANAREVELWCETGDPSGVGEIASVSFDDDKAQSGQPTMVTVEWKDGSKTSRFAGMTTERRVSWNGLSIRSLEFSINRKSSFEVLFSFQDDLFAVRKKRNRKVISELSCQL